ncbi:hypothetical protein [Luteibacter sp.]|uniref:hypothetical protein n=1 Tax=Luteibacter sp. TaxID=1886636 RepID=UPI002808BDFA|nr:hypothetical protein [Luteibacter sp.]MDQ8051316.1 hypothetical protein [Luteibacter sp.]
MKPLTSRSVLLTCGVLVLGSALTPAMAQDNASALDLSVPATPIEFTNTADYSKLPPGASPSDPPWRPFANQRIDPDAGTSSDWQVHGALGVGVGWSKNGGNSNWQTADINMNKTYATDDGGTGHVGVNISIGQYDGPFYGPGYGGGYYGPGPGPMSGPMPAVMPGPMPFGPAPTRR